MNNMVSFIDISTGNVFNGSYPYIFWFDGEQSVDLFYTKNICFLSDSPDVEVKINNNDIFKLVDPALIGQEPTNYGDINSIIIQSNQINSHGSVYKNLYVHMIYILGNAKYAGSYQESVFIDGNEFIIGADFYDSNESLYVNLSNNGVEIPDSIQKALYESNIYEDKKDAILLNRKWKELLSNIIDIIHNKGSYKSLFNSLKWFGYGERLRLCEFWKSSNLPKSTFFSQDILPVLQNKHKEYLLNFSKSTYIGISCALNKLSVDANNNILYDSDKNPILEHIVDKLSTEELSLKLYALGYFYEKYFMPIHLDLIYCTIENIVFSNTFKNIQGAIYNRLDYVNDIEDIKCNIKNGDIFKLGLVECFVGPDTLFGTRNLTTEDVIVGVQKTPHVGSLNNIELNDFVGQMYKNIGSIIDFELELPLRQNEYIKRESIFFRDPIKTQHNIDYQLLKEKFVRFSILCQREGQYCVKLQFDTTSGRTFTKCIKFETYTPNQADIKVYKILHNGMDIQDKLDLSNSPNKFWLKFTHSASNIPYYKQYIPVQLNDNDFNRSDDWKGVRLSNLLILQNGDYRDVQYIKDNYFTYLRTIDDTIEYTICISKQFDFKFDSRQQPTGSIIYRNDYIYVPDFHVLEEIGVNDEFNPHSYEINNYDALCVIPNISFGKPIKDYIWEFTNVSKVNKESIQISTQEPFIAYDRYKFLEPGYYDITFKYNFDGEDNLTNKVKLNSAFRIV